MNDEKEDENPWDEEDAGRTLATASPSFDSNVPSPITVPPPAIETSPTIPRPITAGASGAVRPMNPANKPMPKATLVGLNPADFIKSLPRAGSQPRIDVRGSSPGKNAQRGGAAVAPRFPTPTPAPASASRSSNAPNPPVVHDDDDDSPTMLGVRAPGEPLGDSDVPAPLSQPVHDKFAETMALDIDDDRLPDLSPREEIDEATKVGAHAHELHRLQDAHVIVGQGAVGDEATLAIPSSAELGILPDPSTLGPPLPPQTPAQPPVSRQDPPQTPRFPAAPGFPPAPPVDALEQTQMAHDPFQAPAWQPPPPPHQPPPWQQSVAPMPPLQQMAPQMQPYQQPPPYAQPSSNPAIPVSQPYPYPPPPPQQGWAPQPGMTPYSMGPQPPAPLAPAPAPTGFQITPQIMVLAGVGIVCLAIFVIGIVLFVTTKF